MPRNHDAEWLRDAPPNGMIRVRLRLASRAVATLFCR